MALKALICPSCGARITTFDESTKKGFCPYCDALITDVPDLQVSYEVTGKVAVEGISTADDLAQKAETFRKLALPDKAINTYQELTDADPGDWRGWYGLFELSAGNGLDDKAMDYYWKFYTVADDRVRAQKGALLAEQIDRVIAMDERRIATLEADARCKEAESKDALLDPGPKLHNGPGWIALGIFVFLFLMLIVVSVTGNGFAGFLCLVAVFFLFLFGNAAYNRTKENAATRDMIPQVNEQKSQQIQRNADSLFRQADSVRSDIIKLRKAKETYCS